jgi:peptide/nickel transport system substrate-binding protein
MIGLGLGACSVPKSAAGGPAVRGGTLNMLGIGDVDFMDPNVSYSFLGYTVLRMISRQLLSYPAVSGQMTQVVADLATAVPTAANGGVSADGLTYRLTIRTGAMWNTTPPRQVTAADAVLGLLRTCNPATPFGGLPDFESLIVGLAQYCAAFAKAPDTASAIGAFIAAHPIRGAEVDPANPLTVTYRLTRRASYFPELLTLPAFSPAPVEFLNYLPGGYALGQHTISDGPYQIQSYQPDKSIALVRNPAWQAWTDPVRKAYVNKIMISETGNQTAIQQELQTGSPTADMTFGTEVPAADIPGLLAAKSTQLTLGPTFGDSFVVFNTVSTNNHRVLQNVAVRQAVEEAINRIDLIQDNGGPAVDPPLTHVLPGGVVGSKPSDLYPYNPGKARAVLQAATSGRRLHLVVLYVSTLDYEVKMFQTLQADLAKAGISVTGLAASSSAWTKYLTNPSAARQGVWDLTFLGWGPDWYNNAALAFFQPLFSGPGAYPPDGSDVGFYNDPVTDRLIEAASVATTAPQAAGLWAEADHQVMADAVVFPIATLTEPLYHAAQLHNAVFVPELGDFDPTNVWLPPSEHGR